MILPKISKQSIAHLLADVREENKNPFQGCLDTWSNNVALVKNGLPMNIPCRDKHPGFEKAAYAFTVIMALFDYQRVRLPIPSAADVNDVFQEYYVDFVDRHPICQRLREIIKI